MTAGETGWRFLPKLAPTSVSDVISVINNLEDEGYRVPDFDLSLRAEYLKRNPDGSRNDIAVSKVVTGVKFQRPDDGACKRATSDDIEMFLDQRHANELHRGLWANVHWRADYDLGERDRKYFEAFPHMREFLQ